ncbi:hypothetical protein KSP40_PGU020423 [Platanthera guangdongensis]|uniref:Pentatricopeptide repeat-containing protein n=1 Tax=Platanthera guangdongensis TaxID=2320717 RepID=A0ABR2MHI7_9ASPA
MPPTCQTQQAQEAFHMYTGNLGVLGNKAGLTPIIPSPKRQASRCPSNRAQYEQHQSATLRIAPTDRTISSVVADKTTIKDVAKESKILPPPYYPFNKKPIIEGAMSDVVAHTVVIEAYANADRHSKEAIRTFDRMLAFDISPNAYTYAVLVKGLARDSKISEARKYLLQMMSKGIQPNAPHSTPLLLHLQPPNSPASFHSPAI